MWCLASLLSVHYFNKQLPLQRLRKTILLLNLPIYLLFSTSIFRELDADKVGVRETILHQNSTHITNVDTHCAETVPLNVEKLFQKIYKNCLQPFLATSSIRPLLLQQYSSMPIRRLLKGVKSSSVLVLAKKVGILININFCYRWQHQNQMQKHQHRKTQPTQWNELELRQQLKTYHSTSGRCLLNYS